MLNKKKCVGDQMEWATNPFQFCVATLQWFRDRRGATHSTGAFASIIEDLRAGVPGKACRDRPPWVLCCDKVGSPCVATMFWAPGVLVLRHNFGVATVVLLRGLVSCCDSGTLV